MEKLIFLLVVIMIASAILNQMAHHPGFLLGILVGFVGCKLLK